MKLKHLIILAMISILSAMLIAPSFSQTTMSPIPTPPVKPTSELEANPRMQADALHANTPDTFQSPLQIPNPGSFQSSLPDPSPGWNSTSSYLIGRVGVRIIFVESDGSIDTSTEDWTGEMLNATEIEIKAGLAWWVEREADANLEIVYLDRIVAATSYEPISRASTARHLWIGEILTDLGYEQSYLTAARHYANYVREELDTDWAFTIFVINDLNDTDNKHTDGEFAYAYKGGPLMGLTYENGGWGAENMDSLTAHEFGHIFWALDQYDYETSSQNCDDESGYLYEENQNLDISALNCDSDVASIMRGTPPTAFAAGSLDIYAKAQVGWTDTDADDILDPVDTVPTITVTSGQSSPHAYPTLVFTGTIVDIPLESSSPSIADCSINAVQANKLVVGDTWKLSNANDGIFDSPAENFIALFLLENGTYTLRFRAQNEAGNISAYTQTTMVISSTVVISKSMLPMMSVQIADE